MSRRALTIVFSGMIAADPWQGGATWAVLQYLLGLRRLGHDVLFVEPMKPSSLRPAGATLAGSTNAEYFGRVAGAFDLADRSALLLEGATECLGLSYRQLLEIGRRADVLINVSGMLKDQALFGRVPVRAYLDLDPGFVQLWHAVQAVDMRFEGHTHFLTVGQGIGRPGCHVPTCGRRWIGTLPPVLLEQWPMSGPEPPAAGGAWTTIANWRGYGSVEHDGTLYGQKAHSLRKLIDVPGRTAERLELALAIDPGEVTDVNALDAHGWRRVDPRDVAATPDDYRRFVQNSKGEFGPAKSGYVAARAGWFSDRSACYLASGRPVVAQDTGFSRYLPIGAGLLAFDTADAAVAGMETVALDYARHSRAARQLAEEHLDSDKVLRRLLDLLGVAA